MMVGGLKREEIGGIWMESIFCVEKYKRNMGKKVKSGEGGNIIGFLRCGGGLEWEVIVLECFFCDGG